MRSKGKSRLCKFLINTSHFKQYSSWSYDCYIMIYCPLTFTHGHLRTFRSNWLIGKYSNPNLSTSFNSTCHSTTCSFNLARSNPRTCYGFNTIRPKSNRCLGCGKTFSTSPTLMPLSVFYFFRNQHILSGLTILKYLTTIDPNFYPDSS